MEERPSRLLSLSLMMMLHDVFRYGRKIVLFGTTVVQGVSTLVLSFSPSWIVFCILFFVTGFGQISNYVSAFVLGIVSDSLHKFLPTTKQRTCVLLFCSCVQVRSC